MSDPDGAIFYLPTGADSSSQTTANAVRADQQGRFIIAGELAMNSVD